jgi:branched-chain amino acid aminotransferase
MDLPITLATDAQRRAKPHPDDMGFGIFYSDHMFLMEWHEGRGWHDARIEPYHPLTLDPAAMVLHYAQAAFEGFKAYPTKDGRTLLFRPELNLARMNQSMKRICVPQIDEKFVLSAIRQLIAIDRDWIPKGRGQSLYIRPTVIATEPHIGVRPSKHYLFYVITSPVGAYYKEGFSPVKILVEENYVRAAVGGLGGAKAAANYAASLLAAEEAHKRGWTQVLWLDAANRAYVEEVGTMNIFFMIDGALVTPGLTGSLLPGITRKSVLELADHWGMKTEQRPIAIDELTEASENGRLTEMFGSGTAAIISPVSEFCYKDVPYQLPNPQPGPVAVDLFETLLAIQYGEQDDPFGWVTEVQ